VPNTRPGQTVVAFVVPTDATAPPTAQELRSCARAGLSGFKVPVRWHLVEELPRNANAKVLRRSLHEP